MGNTWSYVVDVFDDLVKIVDDVVNETADVLDDMWNDLIDGDITGLINDLGELSNVLDVIITDTGGLVTDVSKLIVSAFESLYLASLALNELILSLEQCDMGNPTARNECSVSQSSTYKVDEFCAMAGSPGDAPCRKMCDDMGPEWEFDSRPDDGCWFNPCDNKSKMNGSCCMLCCPLPGTGCRCRRKQFSGDPFTCCMNDLQCYTDINNQDQIRYNTKCFEDISETKTCSNNNRSMSSNACRELLVDYCTGEDLDPNGINDGHLMLSTMERHIIDLV